MNGMSWKDLNDLVLSVVLSKIAVPIFFIFSLLVFLRFIFSKVDYINKYFNDRTNSFNIILNYITTYKNETIIVFCIILTLLAFSIYKIKFDFKSLIIIFIYLFGLLRLLTQLFFNI